MLNLLRVLLLGLLVGLPAPSWSGSMTLLGVGKPGAAAPGYTGPGDIQTFTSWWGLRAYSAAYAAATGNIVDLVDQSNAHPITIKSQTNGTLDTPAIAAWVTANSVTQIRVSKLYDQVGTNHMTPGTVDRPVLSTTGPNSSYGVQFGVVGGEYLTTAANYTQAQPYSALVVAKTTSSGGQGMFVMHASFGDGFTMNISSSGTVYAPYAGTNTSTTAAATSMSSFITAWNGASTVNNINGTEDTVSPGTQGIGPNSPACIGDGPTGQLLTGTAMESGYVAGTISIGNRAALNTNMHAAYGGGW